MKTQFAVNLLLLNMLCSTGVVQAAEATSANFEVSAGVEQDSNLNIVELDQSSQQSDLAVLKQSILAARISADKPLREITGSDWTGENCVYIWDGGNTANVPPRLLSKTHACWVDYYEALDAIQTASGTNLQTLKKGDSNGNPYYIDENEEEPRFGCNEKDNLSYFTNNNADFKEEYVEDWANIPFYRCPS